MTASELTYKLPSYKNIANTVMKIVEGTDFKMGVYYKHSKQNFWWYINGYKHLHVVKPVPETNTAGTAGYIMADFMVHPDGKLQMIRTYGWENTKEKCLKKFIHSFGKIYVDGHKADAKKKKKKGDKNGKSKN